VSCQPLSSLAELISRPAAGAVIDKTGLSGQFVYDLRFGSASTLQAGVPTAGDPSLPPLGVALEEQLGIRLESRTEPVEVLVIDSVERPSPD
jgi:uncharacterized protein (TIGR03435 family)